MPVKTVAILSPGDMGHAVGRALGETGLYVITCLQGRSERTRKLARRGNIRDVTNLEEMVTQADLILSILVPEEAVGVARSVADALRATGAETTFADCNAVSPRTTGKINSIISGVGGRYVDGSIIGGPPGAGPPPRFYVSGEPAAIMSELDGKGVDVRQIGDDIGRASGIKMCYAALTKGTFALHAAVLAAAEAMGLSSELRDEFMGSQKDTYRRMEAQVPGLHTKAFRWIGEMEEIVESFDNVGVTPRFHQGAAEMYRLISQTPFAHERPETLDSSRTLEETIYAIAQCLP